MLTHTFSPVSVICSLPSLQQADNLLFPFALYHNFTISAPLTINNSQYLLLLLLFSEYLQYIYFFCVFRSHTFFWLFWVLALFGKISAVLGGRGNSSKNPFTQLRIQQHYLQFPGIAGHLKKTMHREKSSSVFPARGFSPCERLWLPQSTWALGNRGRCVNDIVRRI